MSETNLAAKLKARLSEWQGYMQQSHSARQQAPEGPEAPASLHDEEAIVVSADLLPATGVTDSLREHYESQIANLRSELAQERARAHRLAEELAREKTFNAYARPNQPGSLPRRPYHPRRSRSLSSPYVIDPLSAVLWLLLVVLTIGGLCILVALAVLR